MASFYQCSGVEWKSEDAATVLFDFVDPDGDSHPNLKFHGFSMNTAEVGELSLWKRDVSCGTVLGTQDWSMKKEKKYSHFKLNSTCGAESHRLEAICQKVIRICTEAVRAKPVL